MRVERLAYEGKLLVADSFLDLHELSHHSRSLEEICNAFEGIYRGEVRIEQTIELLCIIL